MDKTFKILSILFLMLVVGGVSANEKKSSNGNLPEEDTVLSEKQVMMYAQAIFDDKMSIPEINELYETLDQSEYERIATALEQKLFQKFKKEDDSNTPVLTPDEEKKSQKYNADPVPLDNRQGCDPGEPIFCWRQPIEYIGSYMQPMRGVEIYFTATTCDNDPSDDDLIIYYPYNHGSNPNSLMYYTSNNQIYTLLLTTNMNLNSYGVNPNNDVRMCIPSRITNAFPNDFIRTNMYLAKQSQA